MDNSDTAISLLKDIKRSLSGLEDGQLNLPQVVGSVKLNSSNTTLILNPSFYYCITFELVGSTSSDVNIYATVPISEITNQITFNVNNTVAGYRIEGIPFQKIVVDSNTIGSNNVYVAFIGYTKPTGVRIVTT